MKNQKVVTIAVISVLVVLAGISLSSATYALFSSSSYGKSPESYTTGLLSIVTEAKSGNISLTNALPKEDDVGMGSEPYVFTVRNQGNIDYKFDIKLLSTSDNSFSPQYIKIKVDDGEVTTLSDCSGSIIKSGIILKAGKSVDISVKVWLSIDTPNTELGKSFESKIVTTGQSVYNSTFNGTSDYVDMGFKSQDLGQSITIGARFKPDGYNKNDLSYVVDNVENGGIGLAVGSDGRIGVCLWTDATGTYKWIYGSDVVTDKYYTAVATYDGQTVKLYVDGKEVASESATGNIKVTPVPFYVGANPNPNNFIQLFKGSISDAFMTREVLDEETIANNFSNDFKYEENNDTYFYYKYN